MYFLIILGISSSLAFKCEHSPSALKPLATHMGRRTFSRESTLAPIRIVLEYVTLDLGSSSLNDNFKDEIMVAAKNYLENVLLVYPIIGPITFLSGFECEGIPINPSHLASGVDDADLVLYIQTDDVASADYVAYAGACFLDLDGNNNVVAGGIVVNGPSFSTLSFEQQMVTMVHEITHVLGFSSGLFQHFKKPDGSNYTTDELTVNRTIRGVQKTLFKTPTVLSKAQTIYECSSLEGVELESDGGSGTEGSH